MEIFSVSFPEAFVPQLLLDNNLEKMFDSQRKGPSYGD